MEPNPVAWKEKANNQTAMPSNIHQRQIEAMGYFRSNISPRKIIKKLTY
jgi:hypothetical protein